MADLSNFEKRRFEMLLNMGGGYVLNFSDRTFNDFFLDNINFDINAHYNGSKANRLRTFWRRDTNSIVGKLMSNMLEDKPGWEEKGDMDRIKLPQQEQIIVYRVAEVVRRMMLAR